jgi:hypothetical protein
MELLEKTLPRPQADRGIKWSLGVLKFNQEELPEEHRVALPAWVQEVDPTEEH